MLNHRLVCLVIAIVALGVAALVGYRNWELQTLSDMALGYSTADSRKSLDAVKKLSAISGVRATQQLVKVVESSVFPDSQESAIAALAERRDPNVAIRLAGVGLQPYQSVGTRRTVSLALSKLPCPPDCVRSILHYLERISNGDQNLEDVLTLDASTSTYLREQQSEVIDNLYAVLNRQPAADLEILREVYGLGTADPSKFSLAIVARLRLHSACPDLKASYDQMQGYKGLGYKGPLPELKTTMESLGCPAS